MSPLCFFIEAQTFISLFQDQNLYPGSIRLFLVSFPLLFKVLFQSASFFLCSSNSELLSFAPVSHISSSYELFLLFGSPGSPGFPCPRNAHSSPDFQHRFLRKAVCGLWGRFSPPVANSQSIVYIWYCVLPNLTVSPGGQGMGEILVFIIVTAQVFCLGPCSLSHSFTIPA